jgi:hypothetical protein
MTCSQIWLSPLVDKSELTSVIYFFGEISQLGDTKKGLATGSKSLFFGGRGVKMDLSRHIMRKCFLRSPFLGTRL